MLSTGAKNNVGRLSNEEEKRVEVKILPYDIELHEFFIELILESKNVQRQF